MIFKYLVILISIIDSIYNLIVVLIYTHFQLPRNFVIYLERMYWLEEIKK